MVAEPCACVCTFLFSGCVCLCTELTERVRVRLGFISPMREFDRGRTNLRQQPVRQPQSGKVIPNLSDIKNDLVEGRLISVCLSMRAVVLTFGLK